MDSVKLGFGIVSLGRWIAVITGLLLTAFLQAQTVDRTSAALPVVSDAYATMTSVKGWSKNHLEQWVELPGAIPYRSKMAIDLSEFTDRKLGADNFTKLEIRKVTVNGKSYPMLLIYRKLGGYLYPTLRRDWTEHVSCRGFVFKSWPVVLDGSKEENKAYNVKFPLYTFAEVQFVELAGDIKSKIQSELQMAVNTGALFDDAGQATIDISKAGFGEVENLPKMESKADFSLLVFPVTSEGKRSVRFLFDYSIVLKEIKLNLLTKSGETGALFNEEIGSDLSEFNSRYFEMPRDAFLSFWTTKFPGDK
jgi:hypothetical protein